MKEEKYNIVILGKSGVGKSSLINYLFNKQVAKTGVGKPVTGVGFHEYDTKFNELSIRIFDTMGLEAGKSVEWRNKLKEELERRSVDKSADNWFHTIYYCICAGGARIEDFEIDTIKMFKDENYKVIIIFTKADQATEKELDELKAVIREIDNEINIIHVCSEGKELRSGQKTAPFGNDDIKKETINNFWSSICLRLPEHCVKVLEQEINSWKKEQDKYIKDNTGYFNKNKIIEEIKKRSKEYLEKLKNELIINKTHKELEAILKLYGTFSIKLGFINREIRLDDFDSLEFKKLDPWRRILVHMKKDHKFNRWQLFAFREDNIFSKIILNFDKEVAKEDISIYLTDFVMDMNNIVNKNLKPEIENILKKWSDNKNIKINTLHSG